MSTKMKTAGALNGINLINQQRGTLPNNDVDWFFTAVPKGVPKDTLGHCLAMDPIMGDTAVPFCPHTTLIEVAAELVAITPEELRSYEFFCGRERLELGPTHTFPPFGHLPEPPRPFRFCQAVNKLLSDALEYQTISLTTEGLTLPPGSSDPDVQKKVDAALDQNRKAKLGMQYRLYWLETVPQRCKISKSKAKWTKWSEDRVIERVRLFQDALVRQASGKLQESLSFFTEAKPVCELVNSDE